MTTPPRQNRFETSRKAVLGVLFSFIGLALLGASEQQLEAVSFGEERPADPGHDEAAWAQNRRADLQYPGK